MAFLVDLNLAILIVTATLTLIMGYVAWRQYGNEKTRLKEQDLKTIHLMISKERHIFSNKALSLHSEGKECQKIPRDRIDSKGNHIERTCNLVIEEGWMSMRAKDGGFIPLSSVSVNGLDAPSVWNSNKNLKDRYGRLTQRLHKIMFAYSPNSVGLGKLIHDIGRVKLPYDKLSYANNVKALMGKYIVSDTIYGLIGVKIENSDKSESKIQLEVCEGKYSDFYDTCDFMTYELAHQMLKISSENLTMNDLPYRKTHKPFEMKNRFVGIGVCTFTILKNFADCPEKVFFLIHDRSPSMAEGGEAFHVVPAGSYEPIGYAGSPEKTNKYPEDTVIREFLEEIIDSGMYNHLASAELLANAKKELTADLFFIGIGLEPLNLKAELLACMVIDVSKSQLLKDRNTYEEFLKKLTYSYEGKVKILEFKPEYLEQYANNARSIPACREILEIIIDHYAEINEYTVENNLQCARTDPPSTIL